MGPAYFVLAIMGCGDGSAACQLVREEERVYRSEVECIADTETALSNATDLSFPEIMADCRSISPEMAAARMSTAS